MSTTIQLYRAENQVITSKLLFHSELCHALYLLITLSSQTKTSQANCLNFMHQTQNLHAKSVTKQKLFRHSISNLAERPALKLHEKLQ